MTNKKNNPEEEKLRQRNKDSAQNAALFWIKLANDRLSEINKQLLGIALILLPLSGSITLSDETLCYSEKQLLIRGWFLLFISVMLGFVQILVDAFYFKYLATDSSSREFIWSNSSRHVLDSEKEVLMLGKVRAQSTHIPLFFQAVTLFFGLTLIMFVMYKLLS